MTVEEFFNAAISALSIVEIDLAIDSFEQANPSIAWIPVGRENNRGAIEASADPGRSLVERLTNGIDAILEGEHETHGGIPDCRSPKEAAMAWLAVPENGLSELTTSRRRDLSKRVTVELFSGEGRQSRTVSVRDLGIGLNPAEMPMTILSLNESNKLQKHYLAGTYAQGGSSTFAVSRYTLIASRKIGGARIGFTLVRFLDLPPDQYKTGHYVYLAYASQILSIEATEQQFPSGTLVRHYGYDLTNYSSPLGPGSVYGLLNQILFDPILPVWLDNRIHNYRRVIKGSRSALNGAVDEGDDSRGPTLSHSVRMFYVSLGEFGRIGVEYWVLEAPTQANKRPIAAFVNPAKPIILSLNGQNHGEMSQSLIKKEADLPYLALRFIGHIDCNSLTPTAKRQLFVSNREEARGGAVYQLVQEEIIKVLRSDDELARLNAEAREHSARERDEVAVAQMRREVARLLRTHGFDLTEPVGSRAQPGNDTEPPANPRPPRPPHPLKIIDLREPPTFVHIIWNESEPIRFYPGQRRYIRIETDANSTYHNPDDPNLSRMNIAVTEPLSLLIRGSTPLQSGRMRAIAEAAPQAIIGHSGLFRVELTRTGLPALTDERRFEIVERPSAEPDDRRITLPAFEIRPVQPSTDLWATLDWPDDLNEIASSAEMEGGTLVVHYSTAFPKYVSHLRDFEQRDAAKAASFTRRYEIWLVTHSLLLHRDETLEIARRAEDDGDDSRERRERCRAATIAALFARREVLLEVDEE